MACDKSQRDEAAGWWQSVDALLGYLGTAKKENENAV
jgi:hypothetical protein